MEGRGGGEGVGGGGDEASDKGRRMDGAEGEERRR